MPSGAPGLHGVWRAHEGPEALSQRPSRKSCGFLEGRGWFPRESPPPDCYCRGEGRGEVESLPAYTNQGPPTRPSLWMPLPLLASPYKGEESEGRPHKSLKSRILIQEMPDSKTGLPASIRFWEAHLTKACWCALLP